MVRASRMMDAGLKSSRRSRAVRARPRLSDSPLSCAAVGAAAKTAWLANASMATAVSHPKTSTTLFIISNLLDSFCVRARAASAFMARKPSRPSYIATRVPPAKPRKTDGTTVHARGRLHHVKENCDGEGREVQKSECGVMNYKCRSRSAELRASLL